MDWRWRGGTWANSHVTETSLWHLDKSAMWQSVEGNSGATKKATEERKTQMLKGEGIQVLETEILGTASKI